MCRPWNDKAKALKPRCFKAFGVAGAEGLEPSARGFGDRCSTNWAIPLYLILPCGNHFDIIHILHHFVNNNYFKMFLWSFFLNLIHNRKNDNNRRRCYCSEKLQSDDALPMTKTGFRIIFSCPLSFKSKKEKRKDKHTKQKETTIFSRKLSFLWWTIRDSNPGPPGYEPDALTNWANGPHLNCLTIIYINGTIVKS